MHIPSDLHVGAFALILLMNLMLSMMVMVDRALPVCENQLRSLECAAWSSAIVAYRQPYLIMTKPDYLAEY